MANVKIRPDFQEPLNLYTLVVFKSSGGKSRTLNPLVNIVAEWQRLKNKEIEPKIAHMKSIRNTREERIKALRRKVSNTDDEKDLEALEKQIWDLESNLPDVPSPIKLMSTDITTEHAATVMAQNQERLGIMSAEGGIFETIAGRYTNGIPNIDLFTQAFSADKVAVDRASKDSIFLDNPRLTLVLAIQPDVLAKMQATAGFRGRGFLARFLYLLPPSNLGKRTGNTTPMSSRTKTRFHERVTEFLDASYESEDFHTIHFSHEAHETFMEFWHANEKELDEGGSLHELDDWGVKITGIAGRIAAIFHCVRHGLSALNMPVSAQDMEAAAATAQSLSTHVLAAFGLMRTHSDTENAKTLLAWIIRNKMTDFTARDAHQNHKSRFREASDLDPALRLLKEYGYIRENRPQEGKKGRPSARYSVNPMALE